ncbi:ParB/RepB/Spo0J family partition protein [Paenibacillus thailandensis]|uniref:ParB/RepB/Spo0J family partition protein n=1 Tax=Paenibacillus thailandensis TaxID=393250 RepID=A0ABW5QTX4_9BACL
MDIVQLPLHLIDEDKDQPRYRFGEESLQELMNSIEELGLLSPIKVRPMPDGRYKIIYGNRRYKASVALNRTTIPCIVSNLTDETEIYLEQIAENLTREGFTPIEEAEAFDKLLHNPRFNSSVKFLAGKLGKPESYIKNKCELLKFGSAVKKLVVSGTQIRKDQLTEDQLLPLKDLPAEYRDSLALIMARDEMPVSDVKKIAKLFKDKDISDSTKAKLLFKTGPGLLETWSTYRLNKQEKEAKAAAAQEAAERKAAGQAERQASESVAPLAGVSGAADVAGEAVPQAQVGRPDAPAGDAAQAPVGSAPVNGSTGPAVVQAAFSADALDEPALQGLEDKLSRLQASLRAAELSPRELDAFKRLDGQAKSAWVARIGDAADEMERFAAKWREFARSANGETAAMS